jgi:simple sugar transport system permease protein
VETLDLIANVAASALRLATPLLLAAMAGLLSYQVGLINIALEGLMLAGAFVGVTVGFALGLTWAGVIAACLVGAALAAVFALFVTTLRANLIVAGLAINFLALGGTAYLLEVIYSTSGTFAPADFESLQPLNVAGLSELPFWAECCSAIRRWSTCRGSWFP